MRKTKQPWSSGRKMCPKCVQKLIWRISVWPIKAPLFCKEKLYFHIRAQQTPNYLVSVIVVYRWFGGRVEHHSEFIVHNRGQKGNGYHLNSLPVSVHFFENWILFIFLHYSRFLSHGLLASLGPPKGPFIAHVCLRSLGDFWTLNTK